MCYLCYLPAVLSDTTPDAAALQIEAYRAMSLTDRFRIAAELSELTHSMAVAGIRSSRPDATVDEAREELALRLYSERGVKW
jgi:hypothetical protein